MEKLQCIWTPLYDVSYLSPTHHNKQIFNKQILSKQKTKQVQQSFNNSNKTSNIQNEKKSYDSVSFRAWKWKTKPSHNNAKTSPTCFKPLLLSRPHSYPTWEQQVLCFPQNLSITSATRASRLPALPRNQNATLRHSRQVESARRVRQTGTNLSTIQKENDCLSTETLDNSQSCQRFTSLHRGLV